MTINELKQLVENLKSKNIPTSIATVENENPYTLLGKINIVIANLDEILKMIEDLSTNKLNASKQAVSDVGGLVTPAVAPTSDKLVGIDNTGAQEQIGIGTGLSIENNVLSASGGGSKLYEHMIKSNTWNYGFGTTIKIISNSNVIFTSNTLKTWFVDNGYTSENNGYQVTGCSKSGNTASSIRFPILIYVNSGEYKILYNTFETTKNSITIDGTAYEFISDFKFKEATASLTGLGPNFIDIVREL